MLACHCIIEYLAASFPLSSSAILGLEPVPAYPSLPRQHPRCGCQLHHIRCLNSPTTSVFGAYMFVNHLGTPIDTSDRYYSPLVLYSRFTLPTSHLCFPRYFPSYPVLAFLANIPMARDEGKPGRASLSCVCGCFKGAPRSPKATYRCYGQSHRSVTSTSDEDMVHGRYVIQNGGSLTHRSSYGSGLTRASTFQ